MFRYRRLCALPARCARVRVRACSCTSLPLDPNNAPARTHARTHAHPHPHARTHHARARTHHARACTHHMRARAHARDRAQKCTHTLTRTHAITHARTHARTHAHAREQRARWTRSAKPDNKTLLLLLHLKQSKAVGCRSAWDSMPLGAYCTWLLAALPPLHRNRAHFRHICAGTGLTSATSAPGLGSLLPHLRRDWAHSAASSHTSGPGLTSHTSGPGLRARPHPPVVNCGSGTPGWMQTRRRRSRGRRGRARCRQSFCRFPLAGASSLQTECVHMCARVCARGTHARLIGLCREASRAGGRMQSRLIPRRNGPAPPAARSETAGGDASAGCSRSSARTDRCQCRRRRSRPAWPICARPPHPTGYRRS
jgi:hypothetical protein